jgi:hypothetical protein
MAFSATRTHVNTNGTLNEYYFDCDFASVTGGLVDTGMANVVMAIFQPTVNDDHGIVYHNYSDAGVTAKQGAVYIDGVTSNEKGKLLVIGSA